MWEIPGSALSVVGLRSAKSGRWRYRDERFEADVRLRRTLIERYRTSLRSDVYAVKPDLGCNFWDVVR
jgi:hypothetical protein